MSKDVVQTLERRNMKLRHLTESVDLDNSLLAAFDRIDMDDAMYHTDNCYAFAFHVDTGTLFVDWLTDRAHGDWFKDNRFGTIHQKEIAQARVSPEYWNFQYRQGDIEHTNLWGRIGTLKLSQGDIEEKQLDILGPTIVQAILNGIPIACAWAIGDMKSELGSMARAILKHGMPKNTVVFSAYKSEQFDFKPFFLSEDFNAPQKEIKSYTQRWRGTIGDSVEK